MVRFKLRWHTLDPFMATAGHYDNKSPNLVKHYAEDCGYKYLSASNKEDFLMNLPSFLRVRRIRGAGTLIQ